MGVFLYMKEEIKPVSSHRKGGVPSRDELYRKVAMKALKAIEVLADIMETGGDNKAAMKIGAARTLLNKALPDLRSSEFSNLPNTEFLIKIVNEIPQTDE